MGRRGDLQTVLNLTPNKQKVMAEMLRVFAPRPAGATRFGANLQEQKNPEW